MKSTRRWLARSPYKTDEGVTEVAVIGAGSMSAGTGLLAVIPARAGSKGLPGKNIRPFAGLPLIAHSILLAKMCPEIDRIIVSTDSDEIAAVARDFGADVPFIRPSELAQDDTPMEPVLRHALFTLEALDQVEYQYVLLLEPTSPTRLPHDIADAFRRLRGTPAAVGIIGVSQPEFNPIWLCVIERDGWMTNLVEEGAHYSRRQDVPIVYRINGLLYIWRTDFVRSQESTWQRHGRQLLHEIPDVRAMSTDTIDEFERTELMVKGGLVPLPWLARSSITANSEC